MGGWVRKEHLGVFKRLLVSNEGLFNHPKESIQKSFYWKLDLSKTKDFDYVPLTGVLLEKYLKKKLSWYFALKKKT